MFITFLQIIGMVVISSSVLLVISAAVVGIIQALRRED